MHFSFRSFPVSPVATEPSHNNDPNKPLLRIYTWYFKIVALPNRVARLKCWVTVRSDQNSGFIVFLITEARGENYRNVRHATKMRENINARRKNEKLRERTKIASEHC